MMCVFAYSILWALYIVTSSRCSRTTPGLTGLCLAMGVAAALTGLFAWPYLGDFLGSRDTLSSLIVVVLFATMLFGLEFLALKRLSSSVFGGTFHAKMSTGKVIWTALRTDEANLTDLVRFGRGNHFSAPAARTPLLPKAVKFQLRPNPLAR